MKRVDYLGVLTRLIAAAGLLLASSGLAKAQSTYCPANSGQNCTVLGSFSAPVAVKAIVADNCQFGALPSSTVLLGDVQQALDQPIEFSIACTSPSRLAVVSSNGLLRNSASAPTGYVNTRTYAVDLMLYDNTAALVSSSSCSAASLVSGGSCGFLGPATTTRGLRISDYVPGTITQRLIVSAPAYSGSGIMIAGAYLDTLTITVSPSN